MNDCEVSQKTLPIFLATFLIHCIEKGIISFKVVCKKTSFIGKNQASTSKVGVFWLKFRMCSRHFSVIF